MKGSYRFYPDLERTREDDGWAIGDVTVDRAKVHRHHLA